MGKLESGVSENIDSRDKGKIQYSINDQKNGGQQDVESENIAVKDLEYIQRNFMHDLVRDNPTAVFTKSKYRY